MSTPQISGFYFPTRMVMGAGSYSQTVAILQKQRCSRLFIAVDRALESGEFFGRIRSELEQAQIEWTLFSDIEPDPSADTVERAARQCSEFAATAVLAIGGGSTIDVAKAVAILATNGGRIHDYEGIDRFPQKPLFRIAIPSTAGTGSEVSGSCVITDTVRNLKMSIRHAEHNPADVAILDPLALVTMPAHVAAHSGLDAFVHALESYVSRQSNLMTDALNLQALELISGNIRRFAADRGDLDAGMKMLTGSALTGICFGQTGLGNVHCMARFVGAFYHLSHGLSNALCLPTAAAHNVTAATPKFARVAAAMGRDVRGLSEPQAAEQAIDAIRQLCADLGIPARLRDAGVDDKRLEEMARLCAEANYDRWNPRATSEAQFLELFQQAY